MNDNEPHFIAGLNSAKQILLALKAKQLQLHPPEEKALLTPSKPASPLQFPKSKSKSKSQTKSPSSPPPPQIPHPPSLKQKTQTLHLRLNQLGSQLYSSHNDIESYEIVFQHLANHYSDNLHILECNEKLKQKRDHLQELIASYRSRIKENISRTEGVRQNQEQMKKIVTEQLYRYFVEEAERSEEVARPRDGLTWLDRERRQGKEQYESEEVQSEVSITLGFAELKRQVTRKPGGHRRPPSQQDELQRPFYQSQLYTL